MKRLRSLAILIGFASSAFAQELITNGSFETPVVTRGTVSYFSSIPGWTAETNLPIEIQNNCCGAAYSGNQLMELDGNAPASMFTDITTGVGSRYRFQFAYSPRPNVGDNRIEVYWDGGLLTTLNRSGAGRSTTNWSLESFTVTATQATTRIRFVDISFADGIGGYLDTVSLVLLTTVELLSVVPGSGVDAGGDLVHLSGNFFTTMPDTTVRFGAAAATIVSVTTNTMDVITPPGTGVVDVSVTNSNGIATLASAYRYFPPEIFARFGNVNARVGDREDVLLVNLSAGDVNREVTLATGQALSVLMASPSSRPSSRYAAFFWFGPPDASTLAMQPSGLGAAVFPTPLNPGVLPQPRKIGNNLDPRLGAANVPTSPAPSIIGQLPGGYPLPLVVTMQGIIQDNGSLHPRNVSLTNAVILRIQ